ncbi:hypothetical protein CLAIMM_06236 [Cladophialophora immunda]|nr:hypothetical protein CLAIMM_06236 [Cladophialophora immunda]
MHRARPDADTASALVPDHGALCEPTPRMWSVDRRVVQPCAHHRPGAVQTIPTSTCTENFTFIMLLSPIPVTQRPPYLDKGEIEFECRRLPSIYLGPVRSN